MDRLSEAVDFYEQHGQRPEELISLGKRLDDLTRQYDRSPEEIIAEAEVKAKRLDPLMEF